MKSIFLKGKKLVPPFRVTWSITGYQIRDSKHALADAELPLSIAEMRCESMNKLARKGRVK